MDKDERFLRCSQTNKYKSKRADFDLVEVLYEYHELIRDDVSKWYDTVAFRIVGVGPQIVYLSYKSRKLVFPLFLSMD